MLLQVSDDCPLLSLWKHGHCNGPVVSFGEIKFQRHQVGPRIEAYWSMYYAYQQFACFDMIHWLVVWLPFFIFPYIGFLIIPTDFHIFQRGWKHQPDSCSPLELPWCWHLTTSFWDARLKKPTIPPQDGLDMFRVCVKTLVPPMNLKIAWIVDVHTSKIRYGI